MVYDKIIFGAGLYGLYAAKKCGEQGQRVLVIERDKQAFMRASYVNQARVHMGFRYPRSNATAIKCAQYFERFCQDYSFCIYSKFEQIYATSSAQSRTNAQAFKNFCDSASIHYKDISPDIYFKQNMCDGAFLTKECAFDALLLKQRFLMELSKLNTVEIVYSRKPEQVNQVGNAWEVRAGDLVATAPFILNATYAGVNDIHSLLGFPLFEIKYEKCEIILCEVSDSLKSTGITVMDGPFFSLMPFGKTSLHSLTSVTFTPHDTCYKGLAEFECQQRSNALCKPGDLFNCNECPAKPQSAWQNMHRLTEKYLQDKYEIHYLKSIYSMKPILRSSEVDDSRPTVIKILSKEPYFVSVLAGKINTVYDLDDVLFFT